MSGLETNVFPIANIADLSPGYRIFRIRGLLRDQEDYWQNRQMLTRRLSSLLRTPALVVERLGEPIVVLREDAREPPSPIDLIRTTVYLEPEQGVHPLDYSKSDPFTDSIRLRFVQFLIEGPLAQRKGIWQPGAGKPFFDKTPAEVIGAVLRYNGYAVRAVQTSDGSIGLCVDVRNKFVSSDPLPTRMSREAFKVFRGRHFVYHYGHRWYEITLRELADLNVSELRVDLNGERVSLLDYILRQSAKPLPQDLVALGADASVASYMTNMGQSRSVPLGLCYLIHRAESADARHLQPKTILAPAVRRRRILDFVQQHLSRLEFGDTVLRVAPSPVSIPRKMFQVPDIEFGNSKLLSVRGSNAAQNVSLDQLGRTRAAMLRANAAGFFTHGRLQRQYIVLPESVAGGSGRSFVSDLRRAVEDLYGRHAGYEPEVVSYNDRGAKTFLDQGKAILEAVDGHGMKPGYALVMLHETSDRAPGAEDQLSALVISKLRDKFDIRAAVHHSTIVRECYRPSPSGRWEPFPEKRGKLSGYVRNVALNKVLLTNEKWPFVLATPLHADITIGFDVKSNTAGFAVVAEGGRIVRTAIFSSKQKEKLLTNQVKQYLQQLIEKEAGNTRIRRIVIHRDGRLWQSERDGVNRAVEALRASGLIETDATVTMLEITKSSMSQLRIFDVTDGPGGQPIVDNPQVGTYRIVDQEHAYLCSTGRAFPHKGTVSPLHIRKVEGAMSIEHCAEDVYALTTLTWSKPDDCARNPITINLTDRILIEDAGAFDDDQFEYGESLETA